MPLFYEEQLLASRVFDKLARLDHLDEAWSAIRQDDYQRFMKVCNSAMRKQLSENVLASVWTQVEDFFMKRVSFGSSRRAATLIDWHELTDPEGWKFVTRWDIEETGPPQVRDEFGESPYPRGVRVDVTASKTIDGVPVVLQFWYFFDHAQSYEDGGVTAAEPSNALVEVPAGHGTKTKSLKEVAQYVAEDVFEENEWLTEEAVDAYQLELEQYHRYNPRKPKWAEASTVLSLDELMDLKGWQVKVEDTEVLYGRLVWSREGPEAEEPSGMKAEVSAKKVVNGVPVQFTGTISFSAEQDEDYFELTPEDLKVTSVSPADAQVTYEDHKGTPHTISMEAGIEDVLSEIGHSIDEYAPKLSREFGDAIQSFKRSMKSMRSRLRRNTRLEFPKPRRTKNYWE